MYKCRYCDKEFRSKQGRGIHYGSVHREEFHNDIANLLRGGLPPVQVARQLDISKDTVYNIKNMGIIPTPPPTPTPGSPEEFAMNILEGYHKLKIINLELENEVIRLKGELQRYKLEEERRAAEKKREFNEKVKRTLAEPGD